MLWIFSTLFVWTASLFCTLFSISLYLVIFLAAGRFDCCTIYILFSLVLHWLPLFAPIPYMHLLLYLSPMLSTKTFLFLGSTCLKSSSTKTDRRPNLLNLDLYMRTQSWAPGAHQKKVHPFSNQWNYKMQGLKSSCSCQHFHFTRLCLEKYIIISQKQTAYI